MRAASIAAFVALAGVARPGPAAAGAPAPLGPGSFAGVLTDDTDVVVFPAARRPAPRPVVTVATRVRGTPAAVGAVLLTPSRFVDALPSLVRADVVATRPSDAGFGPDRLLAWELEIPLFNLEGKAWLSRHGDAVELTLVDGAFAPGHVRFRVAPAAGGEATVLVTEVRLEARSANWVFRRIARHDPWSETAMAAATAWVVARAVALEVEVPHPAAVRPWRPSARITGLPSQALDGGALAQPAFAALRRAGVVARVRRKPDGRLAYVSVAAPVAAPAPEVAARVDAPESWTAFPCWRSVKRLTSSSPRELKVAVVDGVAFVDLDATWRVDYAPSARATVVDGATRGASLAWQVFPDAERPNASLAVLSENPRLDESGFVAGKMLWAEPLMEHALALGLTYANAAAMAERL